MVQTMDWPRDPGIACAQSLNQDNPGIARVVLCMLMSHRAHAVNCMGHGSELLKMS